jgi:hypothetical protein
MLLQRRRRHPCKWMGFHYDKNNSSKAISAKEELFRGI